MSQKRHPLNRFGPSIMTVLLFSLFLTLHANAQDVQVNGALHGTVTDATGALVPEAKVEVASLRSGQTRTATTDHAGFYAITQLPPGHYSVSISKPGFATVAQADLEVLVNQDVVANYTLQVGEVAQHIEVTASASMLQTSSATLGSVIQSAPVVELPLNGRQFTQLILLEPGAAPHEGGQQAFYMVPIGGGGISPATNGQQPTSNTFFLDGLLNNHFFVQAWAVSPPPDAIQEFNVQYHSTDAQYGFTSGANINILTKLGGSSLHGDVWEFVRNDKFDAANFFTNYTNSLKAPYRQNMYGATIGGPLILPGYDGRKKHTYFFGYWEGFRESQGFTEFANVPTAQELGGDFSDILTNTSIGTDPLGRTMYQGQIYNPYTTRQVTAGSVDPITGLMAQGTGLVRDPFAGNLITTPLTPQALTYVNAFYPAANFGPGGNSFPNFTSLSKQIVSSDQFGVALDHTFANNDALSGKFYYTQPDEVGANPMKIGANVTQNHARMATLNYSHLFSPTLLASVHYGYSDQFFQWSTAGNQAGGTALLNMLNEQGNLPVESGIPIVAEISVGPRLSGTNQFAVPQGPDHQHQLNVDIQKVHGSHTLSAGLLIFHTHAFVNGWGTSLGFDQFPTSGLSAGDVNQPATGDGLASLLLNLPSNMTAFFGNTAADLTTHWLGTYAQDKWQVSKKLTLEVGLRWDFQAPPHFKNNEFSMWNSQCPPGNFTTAAAIYQVEEQCMLMPIPYVQLPTATTPNPLSWPVPNARTSIWDPRYNGWEPRLGFAYQVTPKTIVRGGFGMFDDHNQFFMQMEAPRGSWPFGGNAELAAMNRGIPSGLFFNNLPTAASYMQSPTPVFGRAGNPRLALPYAMEFNFGIQQALSPNTSISVDYVGSLGRHTWVEYGYNQPLPNEMGPNAFPNGQPFPFISGEPSVEDNIGTSSYNALQVKIERRFSQGLNFLASYTYSKCLSEGDGQYDMNPQNYYDIRADKGPCDYNYPQLLTFSGVYQLPFGKGKAFGSHASPVLNVFIGGWNLSDITTMDSGTDFTVGLASDIANAGTQQRPNYVPGCQLRPAGFTPTIQEYYNTACYTTPAEYTFGNVARNTLRGPDYINNDIELFKNFKVTESKTLQFRAESFNTFNRANFSPPGGGATGSFVSLGGTNLNDFGAPGFMQIFSAGPGRIIQFGLKFLF